MARAVAICLAVLVLMAAALLGSAGRLAWPEAWAFLGVFAAFMLAALLGLDPDLVRERAAPGPGTQRADARLASLGGLLLYPGIAVVAGLDVGRLHGSPPLPAALEGAALVVFALGYGLAFWAMRVNPFFATFVRIQEERGHRVVREGPYAFVRHPGYAGTLLAHLALPLALGSLWALAPAALGGALFVLRTAREDRALARELPGYHAYRGQVRFRLVPGVW